MNDNCTHQLLRLLISIKYKTALINEHIFHIDYHSSSSIKYEIVTKINQ